VHERDVTLFDAIATALTATDLQAALGAALREIVRALDLAAGWIWILDPETERFYLAAAHDLPPYLREPVQMTGDPCWCMESFLDGDFDSNNVDIIACSRLRRGAREAGTAQTLGLQSHASVVLRFGERRLGLMNVCPPLPRKLTETELRLLSVTGAQIGLAVERGRLAEEREGAARTAERTRLAREIHDTLAQDLTAIALQLESARRDVPADSPAAGRIETALAVAREALSTARTSVLTLRSDPLEGRSLAGVLAALARKLSSETGILVAFHERGATTLTAQSEAELYRIASEALANARLHADAGRIEIELADEGDAVTLRISDDGSGFDPAVREDARYGLLGMEERAHLLGGTLRVVSAPGGGTAIEVRVPRGAR
jgi:two-component system, NarL family, sensor kinase